MNTKLILQAATTLPVLSLGRDRAGATARRNAAMSKQLILKAAVALFIMLAASGVVAACVGVVKAHHAAQTPSADEVAGRQLAARGASGDDLFGSAVVPIATDRTDVPWQAARTVDPDNVRSF